MSGRLITGIVFAVVCWTYAAVRARQWWREEQEIKRIRAQHEAELDAILEEGQMNG